MSKIEAIPFLTDTKLTKREKEIIQLCNDGWQVFLGRDTVFISKGFGNMKMQSSLFWRMYGKGIFWQDWDTNYYELTKIYKS